LEQPVQVTGQVGIDGVVRVANEADGTLKVRTDDDAVTTDAQTLSAHVAVAKAMKTSLNPQSEVRNTISTRVTLATNSGSATTGPMITSMPRHNHSAFTITTD